MDNNSEPIQNYRTYRCWTADTPVDDAIAAFRARYGCEPERVYIGGSMLWVGPVPEAEDDPRAGNADGNADVV